MITLRRRRTPKRIGTADRLRNDGVNFLHQPRKKRSGLRLSNKFAIRIKMRFIRTFGGPSPKLRGDDIEDTAQAVGGVSSHAVAVFNNSDGIGEKQSRFQVR